MSHDQKVIIYRGIIQYLLDTTNYPLHRIANLSNSPIAHLQLIHQHARLPINRSVELKLLKLFIFFVEMELKRELNNESTYQHQLNLEK